MREEKVIAVAKLLKDCKTSLEIDMSTETCYQQNILDLACVDYLIDRFENGMLDINANDLRNAINSLEKLQEPLIYAVNDDRD
jgi:hypothetical protein